MSPGDETAGAVGVEEAAEHGAPAGGRRYGGLTVDERRAVRRQRLLDAGLDLFSSIGYAATTIEGICSTAGVTARHFYEEFGSREDLLTEVFDVVIESTTVKIIDTLVNASDDPDDTDSRVRAGVSAFVNTFLEDPRQARIVCIEAVGVSPEMELHRRAMIYGFAQILQEEAEHMAEAGVTWGNQFTWTTRALVSATNEVMVDWLLEEDPPPPDVIAELIGNLYMGTITYRRPTPGGTDS